MVQISNLKKESIFPEEKKNEEKHCQSKFPQTSSKCVLNITFVIEQQTYKKSFRKT